MNLTDFEQTGLDTIYEAIERQAAAAGVAVDEVEFVGLLPRAALPLRVKAPPFIVLENRLAELK